MNAEAALRRFVPMKGLTVWIADWPECGGGWPGLEQHSAANNSEI